MCGNCAGVPNTASVKFFNFGTCRGAFSVRFPGILPAWHQYGVSAYTFVAGKFLYELVVVAKCAGTVRVYLILLLLNFLTWGRVVGPRSVRYSYFTPWHLHGGSVCTGVADISSLKYSTCWVCQVCGKWAHVPHIVFTLYLLNLINVGSPLGVLVCPLLVFYPLGTSTASLCTLALLIFPAV